MNRTIQLHPTVDGPAPMPANRLLGTVAMALGCAMAAIALLGPLAFEVIDYRISDNMENQQLGIDLTQLVLLAPLALVGGILWWRGHRLAPIVSLVPALAGAYFLFQVVLTPEYLTYPGNNEDAFPLLYGALVLANILGVASWVAIPSGRLPVLSRRLRRALAYTLIAAGSLIALAWSRWVMDVIDGGTTSVEYAEHPAGAWLVKTMDLSLLVPASIATGIGLLRIRPLAVRAAFALTGVFAAMLAAVGTMALVMQVRGDPDAAPAGIVLGYLGAVAFAVIGARLWRAYLAHDGRIEVDQPSDERAHTAHRPGTPTTGVRS